MFPSIYHAMLEKLLTKTKEGKLSWYERNHNGEAVLRHAEYVYKIARMGDTLNSDYRITINDLRGPFDLFSVKADEDKYNEVGQLYVEALRYARDAENIAKEIVKTLDTK